MNAKEFAHELEKAASFIRQQQSEMEELEKENTDLRYLIATKLEQQDGISLNSMAHPITNTPEPSYEIDLDKLETIEIDLPSPEPVAWMHKTIPSWVSTFIHPETEPDEWQPLYTHPVKELTDEEIKFIAYPFESVYTTYDKQTDTDTVHARFDQLGFARAILRKAQEK